MAKKASVSHLQFPTEADEQIEYEPERDADVYEVFDTHSDQVVSIHLSLDEAKAAIEHLEPDGGADFNQPDDPLPRYAVRFTYSHLDGGQS
jgi:hypothetical protein